MRSLLMRCVLALVALLVICPQAARASFHLMQIEQVIGGVKGDASAQAIQLRMRSCCQNFLAPARLIAWDADGLNPVVIFDFTGNIGGTAAGSRILLCTPGFIAMTSPVCIPDYVMTNPIPAAYLASGKLTFQTDTGTIYWSVAWGGYAGPNTGAAGVNDADGQFSPAFSMPLPSASTVALQFPGLFTAQSTNNAADYIITAGAATFTNNAGTSFALSSTPTGQCCLEGGICQVLTEAACGLAGGAWNAAAACGAGACASDPAGACCTGAACTITTLADCGTLGGAFRGEGTACFSGEPNNFIECCRANFDEESGLGVPDIFAFLSAWFGDDPRGDFDGDGTRGVPDIFAFLSAWFAGCS